jgi:hypothetical protein
MIFIAHRGNTQGKKLEFENEPNYLKNALDMGYNIEIDVWLSNRNDEFLLGHDVGTYPIKRSFVLRDGIWCHAKTIETLDVLMTMNTKCFFHDRDDCTLTSTGHIWTFPGKKITARSILVDPDNVLSHVGCYAVCSDYDNI